ncbi:hypothetical protein AB0H37_19015 [Actinomadura sp. NPDC023710]|uniref:hypothetical protein n=1 Tax=Actinomadura sp. NPDC023710 TaxID=3158219 RepID=UPI0033E35DD4
MMQFKINAHCRRGLRIINDIPDIKLCRIEGYNGIGKSSAIRLLELCGGGQPFANNTQSWRTFRDQLIHADIEVRSLQGAERITWDMDPTRWPQTPEPLEELIGTIRIDDRVATSKDVAEILQVERIVVGETFPQTLATRVSREAAMLESAYSLVAERQRAVEIVLGALQEMLPPSEILRLPADAANLSAAESELAKLKRQLSERERRIETLTAAVETSDRLEEVTGHGSELDEQINEITQRLDQLNIEREQLNQQIIAASDRKHRDAEAQRELTNAEKHLTRQNQKYSQARNSLIQAAGELDIEATGQAIAEGLRAAERRLTDLIELRPKIHVTPVIVELLHRLTQPLGEASDAELGEQVLIDASSEHGTWTVQELLDAFTRQIGLLKTRVATSNAERLEGDIQEARLAVQKYSDLQGMLAEAETLKVNRDRAEQRLRNAAATLPNKAIHSLNELLEMRNSTEEKSREEESRVARLRHARSLLGGGQSEEALAARLVQLCQGLDVDPSRLRGRQSIETEALEQLREKVRHASERAARGREVVKTGIANVEATISEIKDRGDLGWLRNGAPSLMPDADASLSSRVQSLAKLFGVLDRARERLQNNEQAHLGIIQALRYLAERLRNAGTNTGTWSHAVHSWLEKEINEWFNNEQVREALFPDGYDVELDLSSMSASWSVNGQRQTRPLDAFSSGEQTLAFTRARLAQLDMDRRGLNRLIALDEFSAFIDVDRMELLAEYLQDRQRAYPNDQVVVILPLSTRSRPDGVSTDEVLSSRIRQLETRGYFAEGLVT